MSSWDLGRFHLPQDRRPADAPPGTLNRDHALGPGVHQGRHRLRLVVSAGEVHVERRETEESTSVHRADVEISSIQWLGVGRVDGSGPLDGFAASSADDRARLDLRTVRTWLSAVDGPALWIRHTLGQWLICTPDAARIADRIVADLRRRGMAQQLPPPPGTGPACLTVGRWTAEPGWTADLRAVPQNQGWGQLPVELRNHRPLGTWLSRGPRPPSTVGIDVVPLPDRTRTDLAAPPLALVAQDGRLVVALPSGTTETRDASELVFAAMGTVTGAGTRDGWWCGPDRVPVVDGPGLWLCLPERDWLVTGGAVDRVASRLAGLGPVPWSGTGARPPVPTPTALVDGRWTPSDTGPAPLEPVRYRRTTELTGAVVPLPGDDRSVVAALSDGRIGVTAPSFTGPAVWRAVSELRWAQLGHVSGAAPSAVGPIADRSVPVVDGPGLWLGFDDSEWLLCGPTVAVLVSFLADQGWWPASTPPLAGPGVLRSARWTADDTGQAAAGR